MTTLMVKQPSFDNAPSWANYCAMDANGEFHWFEKKPVFVESRGKWQNPPLTALEQDWARSGQPLKEGRVREAKATRTAPEDSLYSR